MRTAESVMLGHPDKLCDLIADKIVDEYLIYDPNSKVAIEVQGGHGQISIVGEVRSKHDGLDLDKLIKEVFEDIGYDYKIKKILWNVQVQSPQISSGVERGGAGDSGITVGYATKETPEMLPAELVYAREICRAFDRREGFGPDGKCQVTQEEGKAKIIVSSIQHHEEYESSKKEIEGIIRSTLGDRIAPDCRIIVNPAGPFTLGGFEADTGVTGRKIVQDQYGPRVPVGGGAFSGKDATKVDRSGAYWARKFAIECLNDPEFPDSEALVELTWAIGIPNPVSFKVNGHQYHEKYSRSVQEIIEDLDLRKPNFYERTKKGHYGFEGY
jgi:S-adenosylmethionine synthetase